ncbi:hypothetical protein CARUB_v10018467mg, partial [Capsella rubella]
DKTRDHLFFECDFAARIRRFFTSAASLYPPHDFMSSLGNISCILKLLFQASIYSIWKEKNLRIYSSSTSARRPTQIIKEIQTVVRARLGPLARAQNSARPGTSLLATWFTFFQPR